MLRRKTAGGLTAAVTKCDKSLTGTGDAHLVEKLVDELDKLAASGKTITCSEYADALRQCGDAKALTAGTKLHRLISTGPLKRDRFLGNLLVQMFGKCSSVPEARAAYDSILWRNSFSWSSMITAFAHNSLISEAWFLFDRMPQRDLVCWTGMITAFSHSNRSSEALSVFRCMDVEGLEIDPAAVLTVLDACRAASDVKTVAASLLSLDSDVKVATAVITAFGRCRAVHDAGQVFQQMTDRNLVTWNAMISVYAQNGHRKEAMHVVRCMDLEGLRPNYVTLISALDVCCSSLSLPDGRLIHFKALAGGLAGDRKVASALVNMYGKCGSVDEARGVFDSTPERNVVTWSAMVAACSQNGRGREAFHLAMQMDLEGLLPNEVTMVSVVDACANAAALREGRLVHESVEVVLPELANALIHMYGNCGDVEAAVEVFAGLRCRDGVSWNAMIAAFAKNDFLREALELYVEMKHVGVEVSKLTFTSVFSACAHAGMVELARGCFVEMVGDFGMVAECWHYSCVLDLLGRSGRIGEAVELVESMPFEPSGLELASLLGGCRTHGNFSGGAEIGRQMVVDLEDDRSGTYILLSNIWKDEPS